MLFPGDGDPKGYILTGCSIHECMCSTTERYEGCRFLELGCGTGVLSIYLRKLGLQVVSSDYHEVPDTVEENVAWNCAANHVDHHHVPCTCAPFFVITTTISEISCGSSMCMACRCVLACTLDGFPPSMSIPQRQIAGERSHFQRD